MTTEKTQDQIFADHTKISQVPCPRCGAAALAPCRDPRGFVTPVPHQARRHAAAEAGVYTP